MAPGNFDTSNPGSIINNWIDLSLTGLTLADSTVIYQIEFQMLNDTFGSVCFSLEPTDNEYIQGDTLLSSFYIVDDCHMEPYEVILITAIKDINAGHYGLKVFNVIYSQKVLFSLENQQMLEFHIFDLIGRQVAFFPKTNYSIGINSILLNEIPSKGLYILTTRINNQQVANKIIFQ